MRKIMGNTTVLEELKTALEVRMENARSRRAAKLESVVKKAITLATLKPRAKSVSEPTKKKCMIIHENGFYQKIYF